MLKALITFVCGLGDLSFFIRPENGRSGQEMDFLNDIEQGRHQR